MELNKVLINIIKICAVILCVVIITVFAVALNMFNKYRNLIINGTYLKYKDTKICVSAYNLDDSFAKLDILLNKFNNDSTVIKINNKIYKYKNNRIGLKVDLDKLCIKLSSRRYSDHFLGYVSNVFFANSQAINLEKYMYLDTYKFNDFYNRSLKKYNINAENAGLKVINCKLLITKPKRGRTIDLKNLKKSLVLLPKFVNIKFVESKPAIYEKNVIKLMPKYLLSSFSTDYSSSSYARKTNIYLAESKINNTIIPPNSTFEFYKYVGEPSFARGFMSAPTYVHGKVVEGIGGGMCQVSTTLYNAALLANLKIIKRFNHALPVHYIPLGLDAAVAYGVNTLEFKNTTKGYIWIKASADGATLSFSIYGYAKPNGKVNVYSVPVTYNSADAYRVIYSRGKLIHKEYLGRSTYMN